jgi:hypothetical protein
MTGASRVSVCNGTVAGRGPASSPPACRRTAPDGYQPRLRHSTVKTRRGSSNRARCNSAGGTGSRPLRHAQVLVSDRYPCSRSASGSAQQCLPTIRYGDQTGHAGRCGTAFGGRRRRTSSACSGHRQTDHQKRACLSQPSCRQSFGLTTTGGGLEQLSQLSFGDFLRPPCPRLPDGHHSTPTPGSRKARSRGAVEVKKHKRDGGPESSAAVRDAQRLLAEEKIKAYVERTVAAAPPLTPEQRDRLALLLRGTASALKQQRRPADYDRPLAENSGEKLTKKVRVQ